MIKPWKKTGSKLIGDFRIFKLYSQLAVSPRTGREHDFFVLNSPGWVNVVPVTPEQELVMIQQFRHGSETVELEIPGGMMDPGESDPVATAVRELREETGYEGENARLLGKVFANPAILTNICYTVIIENCRPKYAVDFDHGEDLSTQLIPGWLEKQYYDGLTGETSLRISLALLLVIYALVEIGRVGLEFM